MGDVNHRELAQMFVDAELRARGYLRTATLIHMEKWLRGGFVDPELVCSASTLRSLKYPALYEECYLAMKQEATNAAVNSQTPS